MGLPSIDIYFSFVLLVAIIGLLVATILYFLNRERSFSARLLAGYLLCISVISLFSAFYHTNFFLYFPHVPRTMVFLSLSAAPFAYLYVRSVLRQEYGWQKWDFVFFIPALLYTINMIPFYCMSRDEKLTIIRQQLADNSIIALEPEGWLPEGWGIILRMMYGVILASLQVKMLVNWRRKNPEKLLDQNLSIFRWLIGFTTLVLSSFIMLLIEYAFQISYFFDFYRLITLTMTGSICVTCACLFLQPNLLYGLMGWFPSNQEESVTPEISETAIRLPATNNTFSKEAEHTYRSLLESHLASKQPYLKTGYKISDLSKEVEIPTYMLSAFINQAYGKNFNEWVNENRIMYLRGLLQQNPDYRKYTLEALGKLAGFNSRTTFIAAVKKTTRQTPSEFFEQFLGE
ncbi:MAG: AraC family transcriptional regulator [Sediminibacterium sp.]|nr:AraC family transcriptional regulator [Sediminibacterium sp.]